MKPCMLSGMGLVVLGPVVLGPVVLVSGVFWHFPIHCSRNRPKQNTDTKNKNIASALGFHKKCYNTTTAKMRSNGCHSNKFYATYNHPSEQNRSFGNYSACSHMQCLAVMNILAVLSHRGYSFPPKCHAVMAYSLWFRTRGTLILSHES